MGWLIFINTYIYEGKTTVVNFKINLKIMTDEVLAQSENEQIDRIEFEQNCIEQEEAPEEVKEEPPIVEEIAEVAKDVEPSEEKPSSTTQVMKVLSNTNLNNIIPTNKQEAIDLLYW